MKKFIVVYKQEVKYEGYYLANSLEEAEKMWNEGYQVEYEKEIYEDLPELVNIEEN